MEQRIPLQSTPDVVQASMVNSTATLLAVSLFLLSGDVQASDNWTQYNGSSGDRSSAERLGLTAWPASGPPVTWRKSTAAGFSSFCVADGRVFTLVTREFDGHENETCVALDAETGGELWATALEQSDYERGAKAGASGNSGGDGPRSTPSFADGRVYALDTSMVLHCLNAKSGATLWHVYVRAEHSGRSISWGNAASPLIEGDLVLLAGGGKGQSLLAFHQDTGKLAWAVGNERATHATPVVATLHGQRQVVFFVQSGLVSLDPSDGTELWRAEFPFKTSSAASPVVAGNRIYVSAGYGVGAGVFEISREGSTFSAEMLWMKRNKLINHWSTPVHHDGYLYGLYGFKKYARAPLSCVSVATGEVLWSEPNFGPGNVILVGETVVLLSDAGEVVLVEATPEAYRERARSSVLKGKCWSTPAFSAGQLYVRSTEEGARLDLSGD